jgi:tRNA threonylcarbamoyl adenosine modification protein YeaZ
VRGEEELAHRTGPFGPKTDAWILAAIAEILRETETRITDLDAIAAGCGPGTFTGIRVALAAALGLGAGGGIQVCGISTLDALIDAAQATNGRRGPLDVVALIDARRQQHYTMRATARAYPTVIEPTWEPAAMATEAIAARIAAQPPAACIGADFELPAGVRRLEAQPLAIAIARLAARLPVADRPPPKPSYLRPPDAVPALSPLRRPPL